VLFSAYLFAETFRYLRNTDNFGYCAAPVLASMFTFALAYILPATANNFDPYILGRFSRYFEAGPDQQLSGAILIVATAAFVMWRGFYFSMRSAVRLRIFLTSRPQLRKELQVNLFPTFCIQLIFIAVVAFSIQKGIFGFSQNAASHLEYIDILEILNILRGAGALSLFLISVELFNRQKDGRPHIFILLAVLSLMVLHIGFGFISGFKSQVVMPFVTLAAARFIATRTIPLYQVVAIFLALLAGYYVVEPYRQYLGREAQEVTTSTVEGLFDAVFESNKERESFSNSDVPLATQIATRFDQLGFTTVGMAYRDQGSYDADLASRLAQSLYLAPVLAYIPRALWLDKPSYNTGLWFSQVVVGNVNDSGTSVGMGAITLCYLIGGIPVVCVVFLVIGWLQALLFEGVARSGAGGLIIYGSVCTILILLPTEIGLALGGLLRMLPFAFIAQLVVLSAKVPSLSNETPKSQSTFSPSPRAQQHVF
jgi:hypothetical protein